MPAPFDSPPHASIIIPAYNAAATLPACLAALHAQEACPPFEIIIIDDGSSDDTAVIAAAAPATTVISHNSRRGAAAARNSGLQIARGDVICFTDADCEPKSDWINQILRPFANPDITGCKGTYATRQTELVARFVQIEYEDKYDLLREQERINFIDTYSAAYQRAVLLANDGFDEQIFFVEDQELSFRLAARGYQLVFQPEAIVYHHHSNSLPAYFRKKFKIGYWKAQILRRFPGRAVQDSHTPQVLKLQLLLVALMLTSAFGLLFTPWSGLVLAAAIVTFLLSALPFIRKAWPKDRAVALTAPFFLLVRAAALGFGTAWGLVRPIPTPTAEHTISGLDYVAKRTIDITGSAVGLALTGLVLPFIALAIKLDSSGPIIFKQERVGEEGRPFTLYKFRSMIDHAPLLPPDSDLPPKSLDDPRLTHVGRFLRRWSLDELPQFWNVLKGEMSLVGPRPEETCYVALYDDWQRRRLAVKPGMTGPMQVNGRADLPLDARVQLELDYIQHYSLSRDLSLLLRTIPSVLKGRGAR
jgi:lipopolysaccharide/colanic/teichoic acid biosynthesis glycosyltransferase/glycosyltransferase involved in cell wall biosynthesis